MGFVLFGLTGGIASGKSAVGARFRTSVEGRPPLAVIDADQVARAVVAPGSVGLQEVTEAFGDILTKTGELDRARLRAQIFADADARSRLNALLHPRIAVETQRQAAALAAEGTTLACYEAALLVENGMADAFRPLVVVSLPVELQRARLAARDGISLEAADRAIGAQMPLAEKVAVADYVIDNSGALDRTHQQTDAVLDAIRQAHKSPAVPQPSADSGSEVG